MKTSTLQFAPLKPGTGDEWQVWQSLEFFLDEHGLDVPRGFYVIAQGAGSSGWAAPVVEFAIVDAEHIAYRLDGLTILSVEWSTCCEKHTWQIGAVEVRGV